jgi:outer membrane protein OmpA-like peptidoglycan-associated protein
MICRIAVITMSLIALTSIGFLQAQPSCTHTQAGGLYKEAVSSQDLLEKIVLYQRAIELCPQYAEAHNNLADAYEKYGDVKKAEKEYLEALRLNAGLSSAYLSLGDIYFNKHNYLKAIEYYEKGLAINPNDGLAKENLKIAKDKKGEQLIIVEEKTDKIVKADEILDRLDQVKTMGVGGVTQQRIGFNNILFEFNSDKLKRESTAQLNEIGNALSILCKQKNKNITIEGHTDSIGKDDFNYKLSEKRAQTVKEYLGNHFGIPKSKLKVVGYGKMKPIESNNTEEGRRNNRRVELVSE